jgi:hypothetical protein
MKRLASIIAATAAAAAVAAAITLPAGADDGPKSVGSADQLAAFTSCLRAHGAAIPEGLDPVAVKQWLGDHEDEADVRKAMDACAPVTERREKSGNEVSPEELVSCLHDHGLDAPSKIEDLKPWIVQQNGTAAGKAALHTCGVNLEKKVVEKGPGGGCGDDKAADAAKLRAAKPAPAKPQAAPPQASLEQ